MLDYDSFDFFANLFPLVLLVLPVYRLIKNVRARRLLLAAVGVYLLFLIAPRLALFYLAFWLLFWLAQRVLAATVESRRAGLYLTVAIIVVLLPMVTWKVLTPTFIVDFNLWSNAALDQLSGRWGAVDLAREIIIPLGLSFSTFRGIDLLIKTSLGTFDALPLDELLFFGFFPPVLLIGPVIQYTEIQKDVEPGRTVVWEDLRTGLLLVISGLIKVFVIAYPLQNSADMFVFYETNSVATLWFDLLRFALYFFFNFSGYSDLAIGAAAMLGFRLNRNFNWPYTKTNPQDFWNNWHMSLTHFFQRNVFVPFGGMRRETQYRAIFLTMMAIALWHDVSIPLVVFGIYHTCGLIAHRLLVARRPPSPDQGVALTTVKASLQFVWFATSLPLMVIGAGSIIPVYAALVGLG